MTDLSKSPELQKAEDRLKDLERHRRAVAEADTAHKNAMLSGDKDAVAKAAAVHQAAVQTEKESGITQQDIDQAAQEVLDARGETHSETNILPPDHGIRTADADADLAIARSRNRPALIKEAEANLVEAQRLDAEEKAAHVAAAHQRTIDAQKGEQS